MKTIEEKNRMIAVFMGFERLESYKIWFDNKGKEVHQLEFHISWDWLMPVVDAIYNTGLDEQNTNEIGDVTHALLDVNISAVHEAVVKFIEMYNNQK